MDNRFGEEAATVLLVFIAIGAALLFGLGALVGWMLS